MTDPLRSNPQWVRGGTLACQESFAPTLMQRMEQANSAGKTAMVSSKVDEVKVPRCRHSHRALAAATLAGDRH